MFAPGQGWRPIIRPQYKVEDSGKTFEQARIGNNQAVFVNLDLADEVAVQRFVSVAPQRLKAGVTLRVADDCEVGEMHVCDSDFRGTSFGQVQATDRQGVGNRARRKVYIDRAVERGQRMA